MALPGAKPRADRSQVVTRHKPAEWSEYPNVPFAEGPALPVRNGADDWNDVDEIIMAARAAQVGEAVIRPASWPSSTRRWWEAVRQMPHCVAWTATDWEFAFYTAEVHARTTEAWRGYTGAELRQREKLMGVYADARRDLRIRYVDPTPEREGSAEVVKLADYRAL